MINNIFRVTSPSGNVSEYFDSRNSAIEFIIDEFATALAFRLNNEGKRLSKYLKTNERKRLSKYLKTNDETPNQYPFKYKIEEIKLNKEFTTPKSIYMVCINRVEDGVDYIKSFIYYNYEDAKVFFDNFVDEDIAENLHKYNVKNELDSSSYERWFEDSNYSTDHLKVFLSEFIEDKDGSFKVKS